MNLSLGRKADPEKAARDAIRKKKWKKAIDYYEHQLKSNERDFALWNLVGDLHASNKSIAQAMECWRHALEGYVLDGLFDSVLGIGRKMIRYTPEEEDINLILAEAYMGMEYYADCLGTFRSYMKLAKHRSEPDMRSLFKKIMDCQIRYPHLLDEISTLYKESGIEDIELEKSLEVYIEKMTAEAARSASEAEAGADDDESSEDTVSERPQVIESATGLAMLGGLSGADDWSGSGAVRSSFDAPSMDFRTPPSLDSDFEIPSDEIQNELPDGEGKDHYDLGMVYTEMSLWDAAISEFENARRDPTFRHRATLGLANCYQNTNDLQKALNLLEAERKASNGQDADSGELHFQLGEIHELLGNMEEALHCFETIRGHQSPRGAADDRIRILQNRLQNSNDEAENGGSDLNSWNGQG
jgi:tetratricopeptide (TPR) repeat protein